MMDVLHKQLLCFDGLYVKLINISAEIFLCDRNSKEFHEFKFNIYLNFV